MSTTAPSPFHSAKAVIIYGPQGCGKSRHKGDLAAFYGKTLIIDGWTPDVRLPVESIALTSFGGIDGAIDFDDAMLAMRRAARKPYDWNVPSTVNIRRVTFAIDHLIAIEMALEDRIVVLQQRVAAAPDCMVQRDALDVAHQALELVQ
jgi:hypothetical protein